MSTLLVALESLNSLLFLMIYLTFRNGNLWKINYSMLFQDSPFLAPSGVDTPEIEPEKQLACGPRSVSILSKLASRSESAALAADCVSDGDRAADGDRDAGAWPVSRSSCSDATSQPPRLGGSDDPSAWFQAQRTFCRRSEFLRHEDEHKNPQ